MPIFLDPEKFYSELCGVVPRIVNEDGSIQHVICDGARFHVLSWSTLGTHCSEPDCEINRERERRNAKRQQFTQ